MENKEKVNNENNISSGEENTGTPVNYIAHTTNSNKKFFIAIAIAVFVLLVVVSVYFLNKKDAVDVNNLSGNNIIESANSANNDVVNIDSQNNNKITNDSNDSEISEKLISDCDSEYNKLLNINGFDFDKYCKSREITGDKYNPNDIPKKNKNLVLIFDASGSMAGEIDGKKKIDIAKEAASKFIDQISNEENFNLSVVVYGHKGSNRKSDRKESCKGIEEIYSLGKVDSKVVKSKLNKFNATGWTPIADSFLKAKDILAEKNDDENFILLVSDGKEMCGGNPVATIKKLKENGLNVKADVIGFDVGGADETQLKSIASAGDGDYFSVSTAVDLENAFAKHKEMLNKADFKIGQVTTNLYDISYAINDYNQCRVMLEKEKIAMMLDIHVRKLSGEKCELELNNMYLNRYNKIGNKIKNDYISSKNSFERNNIKNN